MQQQGEWITGNIVLNIQGKPLEMEMTVPATPVKPQRMLPVFQKMANSFVKLSVDAVEAAGKEISCKAGCGACCRQPVPLAEVEAYQLAELVESMPEPRRTEIKNRFRDGNEHFSNIGWFERLRLGSIEYQKDPNPSDKVVHEFVSIAVEYFNQGIPCPFLENESCSIHENRPLACREYLVTSPAENCSKIVPGSIDRVELLIKPSRPLRRITRTENSDDLGAITMIGALDFAEKHPEEFPEKVGQQWAGDFFGLLAKTDIPDDGIKKKHPDKMRRRKKRAGVN
ncbi:MAG: YkgJ family cysteine cluster protein [Saprospiraceae bacterium]|nr:YkgJ family cysteine cluster protein [Pyrinomonadaceae bacterium]